MIASEPKTPGLLVISSKNVDCRKRCQLLKSLGKAAPAALWGAQALRENLRQKIYVL